MCWRQLLDTAANLGEAWLADTSTQGKIEIPWNTQMVDLLVLALAEHLNVTHRQYHRGKAHPVVIAHLSVMDETPGTGARRYADVVYDGSHYDVLLPAANLEAGHLSDSEDEDERRERAIALSLALARVPISPPPPQDDASEEQEEGDSSGDDDLGRLAQAIKLSLEREPSRVVAAPSRVVRGPPRPSDSQSVRNTLANFQVSEFRGLQARAIDSLCLGRDTCVIAATGTGKSLTFQLPAQLPWMGAAVVIVPLVSLAVDQIKSLASKGIRAIAITEQTPFVERQLAFDQIMQGALKHLYVSPELFQTAQFKLQFSRLVRADAIGSVEK